MSKLSNKTIVIIAFIAIITGILLVSASYLKEKKDKAYQKISISLYEKKEKKDSTPQNIEETKEEYKFEIGKGVVVREGTDLTIFATGLEVYESLKAAEKLAEEGINAEVIDIHTIKPIDAELIVKSVSKTGRAVTVEEHSLIGGLYSAVSEVLAREAPAKVLGIGVHDCYGHSGEAKALLHEFKLDAEGIYEQIKASL